MLYYIVRPIARVGLKTFYRKIYLSNTKRIPRGKPVILAANHPTAFLEPCILAVTLEDPLHFLVRGDLFKKDFYARLLNSLHMLPIFRLKDGGYDKVKTNYATFEACFHALEVKKTLMILAEGRTIQEKRLRPLQKGTARIALGTLDRYPHVEDVYIVPVGVTFSYADQPRTEVMIDFGEPLPASQYMATYQENANQAISDLTDELRVRLEKHMVIIEREEDDELVEYLQVMHRSESRRPPFPILSSQEAPIKKEIEVADVINRLPQNERSRLLELAGNYFEQLGQLGLDDLALVGKDEDSPANRLKLILGYPLYLLGYSWSFPPAWLGKYIARTKIKTLEFKMPVRWAATLGAFLAYLLLWVGLAGFTGKWLLLPIVALLLLLGGFALYYREFRERIKKSRRRKSVPAGLLSSTLELRKQVFEMYRKLAKSYA